MLGQLVGSVCERFAQSRYARIFARDGDAYLSRYLIASVRGIGVYLHKFHRSDQDRELHNHPWKWAFSIILTGGYREERRIGESLGANVWARVFRPGAINVIRGDTFHRVDLLDEAAGCWTFFVAGPKTSSWGFWNRHTGAFTPHREFVGGDVAREATSK